MLREIVEKIVVRHTCKDGFRYDSKSGRCVKITPMDKKRMACKEQPGKKWDDDQHRCVKMSPEEIMKAKKAAKKRLLKMKNIQVRTKKVH